MDLRPPFAYAHLCRPLSEGGLGLIDCQAQQRNLQVRWINHLVNPPKNHLVSQYLRDYICRFHSGDSYSLLGLFLPKLRRSTDHHLGCIDQSLFRTFDAFPPLALIDLECSVQTFLQFPAINLFDGLAPAHWLHKSRSSVLRGYHFFTFDPAIECLRPLFPADQPPYPLLAKKMVRELENHSLCLLPYLHILTETAGHIDDTPFTKAFSSAPDWRDFESRSFRRKQTLSVLPFSCPLTLDAHTWCDFWTFPLDPTARSLWYRILFRKVYCQKNLARFDSSRLPICSICLTEPEDHTHFFISCPFKYIIWQQALFRFAPHIAFTVADIASLVFSLSKFKLVKNKTLKILVSKILWAIWRYHWLFIIEHVPFQPDLVLNKIYAK